MWFSTSARNASKERGIWLFSLEWRCQYTEPVRKPCEESKENTVISSYQTHRKDVILLSAKFSCVLKGLGIKENSLTTSVTSTKSAWIEISSLRRTKQSLYYQLSDWDGFIDCDMLRDIRHTKGRKKQLYCNYLHAGWSDATLECELEIKFLGVSTECPDNRPRRAPQLWTCFRAICRT